MTKSFSPITHEVHAIQVVDAVLGISEITKQVEGLF